MHYWYTPSPKSRSLRLKGISRTELVTVGFCCLQRAPDRSYLSSRNKQNHSDSSSVQLDKDQHPSPSLRGWEHQGDRAQKAGMWEKKGCENKSKRDQRQDLISNQRVGCSYATNRISAVCELVKICCFFHFRTKMCCVMHIYATHSFMASLSSPTRNRINV